MEPLKLGNKMRVIDISEKECAVCNKVKSVSEYYEGEDVCIECYKSVKDHWKEVAR